MRCLLLPVLFIACICLVAPSLAADRLPPPIINLDAKPEPVAYDIGRRMAVEIHSAKEAAKYFNKQAIAEMMKKMDFSKRFILVFGWRGSGQDHLGYAIKESFPQKITFRLEAGRTADLKQHAGVFAIQREVFWISK